MRNQHRDFQALAITLSLRLINALLVHLFKSIALSSVPTLVQTNYLVCFYTFLPKFYFKSGYFNLTT